MARTEKQVEHDGDVFMRSLGFDVIRFSQPRATMQTMGIPDRRYYRAPLQRSTLLGVGIDVPQATKALSLWWEAKRAGGEQSAYQRQFQELVEACGEQYVCGTDAVLHEWAVGQGLVRRLPTGFLRLV